MATTHLSFCAFVCVPLCLRARTLYWRGCGVTGVRGAWLVVCTGGGGRVAILQPQERLLIVSQCTMITPFHNTNGELLIGNQNILCGEHRRGGGGGTGAGRVHRAQAATASVGSQELDLEQRRHWADAQAPLPPQEQRPRDLSVKWQGVLPCNYYGLSLEHAPFFRVPL